MEPTNFNPKEIKTIITMFEFVISVASRMKRRERELYEKLLEIRAQNKLLAKERRQNGEDQRGN